MRFNESSCVKCRLQAVFKYASQCIIHACCSFKSFIPMIDIDCSFAISLSLFLSFPLSLTHFYYSHFFFSSCFHRSFARELSSSSHSIYITYGLFWFLICAHQQSQTRINANPTHIQCQQFNECDDDPKPYKPILPTRMIASVCFKRNRTQNNSGQEQIESEGIKKLRTLTQHTHTLYQIVDEQDKTNKVCFILSRDGKTERING